MLKNHVLGWLILLPFTALSPVLTHSMCLKTIFWVKEKKAFISNQEDLGLIK